MRRKAKPRLHSSWIDYDAKKIVKTLKESGYETYLVGGCVRDLLYGRHPKDFDIATSATPEQVKSEIRGSHIIGKRFRLVLVRRGEKQFEVSTFRRSLRPNEKMDDIPSVDNLFGTPEEDAFRRDLTINALFYDPIDDILLDHTSGQQDLEKGIIRIIGEPDQRLIEDPIRILRSLRLAHLLSFTIEPTLRESMQKNAGYLVNSVLPRRREEYLKLFRLPQPTVVFHAAKDLDILKYTLPTLDRLYDDPEKVETFDLYFERIHNLLGNKPEPTDLFAIFILAYWRTMIDENPLNRYASPEIMQHPDLLPFMRDELGMFKYEQVNIAHALHLQSYLMNIDHFKKRGQKRKIAFLRNSSLSLALLLAQIDYSIGAEDLLFWREQLNRI